MKLTLAITTFNRFELTVKSFANVIDDNRIDDIIILDDCSTDGSYEILMEFFDGNDKIRVIKNERNIGISLNKNKAISLAKNNKVIIFDSDNTLTTEYIDALFTNGKLTDELVINIPEFAEPNFNFTKYSGEYIDYNKAKLYMSDPMFRCAINCCNYVVDRNMYLQVYKNDDTVKETDTLAFSYLWLKYGYSFYVVKGMRYNHLVHENSGWLSNANYNMAKAKEYEQKIMEL